MDNGLLLGEISGTNGESGRGNDRQTDGDTNDEKDQSVMEEGVGAALWGRYAQVVEETSNPGSENPENDKDQKGCTDGVHDSLEMTLILGARNERCSATNEGHLGGVSDDSIGLSTFAAGSVVDDICDVLVDGEGFSSHGRLIDGKKGVSRTVFLFTSDVVLILVSVVSIVTELSFQFTLILSPSVRVVVCRDNASVGGGNLTILDYELKRVNVN